jgi:hypothetical protein
MEIVATKKLNLKPIGQVRFSFKKRKGYIWVGEVNIMNETDLIIDFETYKALLKEMKAAKTDLLTDGTNFYTTRGERITQVKHHDFYL